MLRIVALWLVLLVGHLGARDRRKGSHRQATHGNRYRTERGKRILASAGGSKSSKKERSAAFGRKITEANFGAKKRAIFADKPKDDDDPFAEDFGPEEEKTPEQKAQEKLEKQLIAQMEKADRQKVFRAIQDQGGLKTNPELREEYAGIPNTFKRKDGMGGDEMADHLKTYYPELGIEDERDLIDYLAA